MIRDITAAVLALLAAGAWIVSVRSFREKGFLFNNAWLFAAKRDREKMDKRPHYRQTAVVFLLLGACFACDAAAVLWELGWLSWPAMAAAGGAAVYAAVSAARMARRKKTD